MITILIAPFLFVFQALLAIPLFTVGTCPAWMSDAVYFWSSQIEPMGSLLPITDLLTCIGLIMTFEATYLAFKVIVFSYKRIKS
jgi:hypothetical protein